MKGKLWLYALLVVAVALFVAIAVTFYRTTHSANACNYNDASKSYIKTAPNCVINFMCTKDRTAFRDACGCGCQLT